MEPGEGYLVQGARLTLDGLGKSFGDVVAVAELSLEIEEGTFVTLLGPSGCGKTTTLNLIAGFETPDRGVIALNGQPMNHLPPYRRPVNTVFQGYALFPHLSVADNVAFGLRMKKMPKDEIARRVARGLGIVRLDTYGDRKPDQLSGGQQQRVALARAFVNEPQVLLLDEPLSALDAQLRKQMQIELKNIQQELGITFIYVTHDQEEALVMSDLVCVMNQGRAEQIGSAKELYDRPATAFVAEFLGRNNFLKGTAETGPAGRRLTLWDGRWIDLMEPVPDGPALLSIRPERLELCAPSDEANVLPGVVVAIRFLGDRLEAKVEVADGVSLLTYATDAWVATGEKVAIRVPAEHCRYVGAP